MLEFRRDIIKASSIVHIRTLSCPFAEAFHPKEPGRYILFNVLFFCDCENCAKSLPLIAVSFFTAGGVVLGGILVRRFDLKRSLKMAARFCVVASVFTLAGSGAWFIPGCGTPDLAGVLVPYNGR